MTAESRVKMSRAKAEIMKLLDEASPAVVIGLVLESAREHVAAIARRGARERSARLRIGFFVGLLVGMVATTAAFLWAFASIR